MKITNLDEIAVTVTYCGEIEIEGQVHFFTVEHEPDGYGPNVIVCWWSDADASKIATPPLMVTQANEAIEREILEQHVAS